MTFQDGFKFQDFPGFPMTVGTLRPVSFKVVLGRGLVFLNTITENKLTFIGSFLHIAHGRICFW